MNNKTITHAKTTFLCPGKTLAGTVIFILCAALVLLPAGRFARAVTLPEGGSVTSGSGSISQSGSTLTVTQKSQKMIADWDSFDISRGGTVNFVQPNSQAAALNRIHSGKASTILGNLNANGQIFLINPSGVIFGASAKVNVGGLVASSLDMKDSDFLDGNYRFFTNGSAGAVSNAGSINARYAALLSPQADNAGTISADAAVLAAGSRMNLDLGGDGLISCSVDQGAVAAQVENSGLISAGNGLVYLSATALNSLTFSTVNNSGIIEATGVSTDGGHIILEAEGGSVNVSGTLDVSSENAMGGSISVTGDDVLISAGAALCANGATGGGQILVGGDWQGSGELYQAATTTVQAGAAIEADATDTGDGGTIVVYSDVDNEDSVTTVNGTLSANGGENGGNGGNIETSGHTLDVAGISVSASATNGNAGLWLLDPYNITIAASGESVSGDYTASDTSTILAGSIETVLNGGTDITISTGGLGSDGDDDGNITVNADMSWGSNILTLSAYNNIEINAELTATNDAGLALEYGQGSSSGTIDGTEASYTVNAAVNLESTCTFTTKLGSDGSVIAYTIITSLGEAGSTTGQDLQGINGNLSGNYVLGSDIDASDTSSWNSGEGFDPLGDNSTTFTGIFDGLGHTISDLYIYRAEEAYAGLFGFTDGAVIANVGLSDVDVTVTFNSDAVDGRIGGLAGGARNTSITNSYAAGNVAYIFNLGDDSSGSFPNEVYIGGLVGYNYGSSGSTGSITNSYAACDVSYTSIGVGSFYAGGLVGYNGTSSRITNSYATGNVADNYYVDDDGSYSPAAGGFSVGGLVGGTSGGGNSSNVSIITNSYATGDVYGSRYVTNSSYFIGGLVGSNGTNSIYAPIITSSYATGDVVCDYAAVNTIAAGGLVGVQMKGAITSSYATGAVSTSGGTVYAGGLLGYNFLGSGSITNSYWDTQTSGMTVGVGEDINTGNDTYGVTGQSSSLSFYKDTLGWDIDDASDSDSVWCLYRGYAYPRLRSNLAPTVIDATRDDATRDDATPRGGVTSGRPEITPALNSGVILAGQGGQPFDHPDDQAKAGLKGRGTPQGKDNPLIEVAAFPKEADASDNPAGRLVTIGRTSGKDRTVSFYFTTADGRALKLTAGLDKKGVLTISGKEAAGMAKDKVTLLALKAMDMSFGVQLSDIENIRITQGG